MRGAESFNGKPWNSFIRYEASDGTQRLSRSGQVSLVVRRLGRERCNFVVVWRMREASTRADTPLLHPARVGVCRPPGYLSKTAGWLPLAKTTAPFR